MLLVSGRLNFSFLNIHQFRGQVKPLHAGLDIFHKGLFKYFHQPVPIQVILSDLYLEEAKVNCFWGGARQNPKNQLK